TAAAGRRQMVLAGHRPRLHPIAELAPEGAGEAEVEAPGPQRAPSDHRTLVGCGQRSVSVERDYRSTDATQSASDTADPNSIGEGRLHQTQSALQQGAAPAY